MDPVYNVNRAPDIGSVPRIKGPTDKIKLGPSDRILEVQNFQTLEMGYANYLLFLTEKLRLYDYNHDSVAEIET